MSLVKCYLIGGAPLSGKTTLSSLWAAKHQASQLSTDSIREWMKMLTRNKDYPLLFEGSALGPDEFYKEYDTPQKVVDQQVDEGKDVLKGIEAFLSSDQTIKHLIVEGIAITPESAKRLQELFPNIQFETTFLFDDNIERITKRIHERGLWGPKDTYPDYIKSKEADWVILYNEFYKTEARKHGFPLVYIDELDN